MKLTAIPNPHIIARPLRHNNMASVDYMNVDDIRLMNDSQVDKMKINDLKASLKTMIRHTAESKLDRILKELQTEREERAKLSNSVQNLTEIMETLSTKIEGNTNRRQQKEPDEVKTTLLIGDSTLRDIDETRLCKTEMKCQRNNGKVNTVKDELSKLKEQHCSYENVVVVVGTNDCANLENDNIENVVKSYSELIDEAKNIAVNTVISSIIPRSDVRESIDIFNDELRKLCDEKRCTFVDQTPVFTLRDDSVNDGYVIGTGPHLIKSGTNRLIKSLKIQTTQEDVTRRWQNRNQPQRPTQGTQWRKGPGHTRNDFRCQFCNERGHNKDTCRHGQPVTCRACGQKGHKDKHCN